MANREIQRFPGKRRQEEWRYEDWMDEDDLPGGDLRQEQDLRIQLQRGSRFQGEDERGGYKGRRVEGSSARGDQGEWDQDRFGGRGPNQGDREQSRFGGKGFNQGMPEYSRPQGQQGSWYPGQQSGPSRQARQQGQEQQKDDHKGGLQKVPSDIKCYRCLQLGHQQFDYENEPVCYKCKQSGHMAVDCKNVSNKRLKMYGFGIPGQGFYSIDIPEVEVKTYLATGLLTSLEGEATEEKLDQELKNLVQNKWNF